MDFIKYVIDNEYGEVLTNTSFFNFVSIGVGGKIQYLYMPKDEISLAKVFAFINENHIKYYLLGNGTNTLPSDNEFLGVVIYMKNLKQKLNIYDDHLIVSASYSASKLANHLKDLKIGNLAFLAGIPGLIGGCIKQNSGCFNEDISKHLISIRYIDQNGEIKELFNKEMKFGYRYSIFEDLIGIIIEGTFKIEKNVDTENIIIENQKHRVLTQPLNCKNMGSTFKNDKDYKAYQIIDMLNMRGYKIGGSMVSLKHANFIVNNSLATSSEIKELIRLIKERAKEELDITLECEINVIDD